MKHELKIWPQYYHHVSLGTKTFEIRENDRGFQMGDEVVLREWDPTEMTVDDPVTGGMFYLGGPRTKLVPKGYTERPELRFTIGYVLPIENNKVIFSLTPWNTV